VRDTVADGTPIGQHIGIHKLYLFIKLIDLSRMLIGLWIIILALVWIASSLDLGLVNLSLLLLLHS